MQRATALGVAWLAALCLTLPTAAKDERPQEMPYATPGEIPILYEGLASDLQPGDVVLIDDGRVVVTVTKVEGERVHAGVTQGGRLRDRVQQVGDVVDQRLQGKALGGGPALDRGPPALDDGAAVSAQEIRQMRRREVGVRHGGGHGVLASSIVPAPSLPCQDPARDKLGMLAG